MLHESERMTYADLLLLPDDGLRHELIDGVHYVTASPVTRHQRILRRLAVAIEKWLEDHPAGEMFFAPLDVVLTNIDVVVPDLIYISSERSAGLEAKGMFAAPDLAVEILSPPTRKRDKVIKRKLYERENIREYWLIDPDRNTVDLHRNEGRLYVRVAELTESDVLTTPLFPGLELRLSELFR